MNKAIKKFFIIRKYTIETFHERGLLHYFISTLSFLIAVGIAVNAILLPTVIESILVMMLALSAYIVTSEMRYLNYIPMILAVWIQGKPKESVADFFDPDYVSKKRLSEK